MANNTKEMAEFFDRLAPVWASPASESAVRDEIIARIGLSPNSTIADIGCGKGVMVPHLLALDPKQILEIDVSPVMISYGQKLWKDPRISFFSADLFELELPPLDLALIFNAYPHFTQKAALAKKLSSCVKEGGSLVIAHSRSKETINGAHRHGVPDDFSITLKTPPEEAEAFLPYFKLTDFEDNNRCYFLKMVHTI